MAKVSNAKLYEAVNSSRLAQENALRELTETLSKPTQNLGVFNDNLTNLNNLLTTMSNNLSQSSRKKEESDNKLSNITNTLTKRFSNLAKVVADTANRYSQISNELITVSGATGSNVRETRAEIVQGIVKQLNKETDNFLNPEKSYQKMVDIANQANIGNLEALEEITRPMLLASETMNVKNAELASLFNRWYTRYNFSSLQMESMVDEIRGNTAGNNATAEATMENISKFQNFIGVYADSTKEMQNMVEAISQESSRLESVGINSGYIFDYMKQIGQGDTSNITAIQSLLSNSNTGMNWTEAQSLLRSGNAGDMKLVSEALAEGAKSIGDKVKDNALSAEAIKAYGLDVEEIYNILSASGVLKNSDEFMDSVSGAQSAVESLDDKFNTHSDKLNNIVLTLSEHFAKFQENWGVAISDILKVGGLIYTAIQFRKLSSNLSGSGGPGRLVGGLSGGISATSALTVGGVAAGGLLAFDGLKGVFDKGADTAEKSLSGIEAAGGIGGALLLGAGAKGATIAGVAAGPIGWAVLAAGGLAFLGKKAYEDATSLGGNAEAVSKQIENVRESLEKENTSRISQLGDLQSQFDEAKTLDEKKRVLEESGLFTQKDLNKNNAEALQELIDSYKKAAKTFNTTSDEVLTYVSNKYKGKEAEQTKEFMSYLGGMDDSQDRMAFLSQAEGYITDEKLLKKIKKAKKDKDISDGEWEDILRGGANSWFDNHTLYDQGISKTLMKDTSGFFNWGLDIDTSDNGSKIASYIAAIKTAPTESAKQEAIQSLKDAGYYKEAVEMLGKDYVEGNYAKGSNYIESDQTARIHEGEAVVPKKYNPAANVTELEMLRKYYKESTTRGESESLANIRELISVMSDIREFLAMWKDDNDKREDLKSRSNRLNASSDYIARFMATSY